MVDAEIIKILAEIYGELEHQPIDGLSENDKILKTEVFNALIRCIDNLN